MQFLVLLQLPTLPTLGSESMSPFSLPAIAPELRETLNDFVITSALHACAVGTHASNTIRG